MRDASRIPIILWPLERCWEEFPELDLHQLENKLYGGGKRSDARLYEALKPWRQAPYKAKR